MKEARERLSSITAAFREHGAAAGIVVIGSHRKPEAAVIPYALVELLDPVIEDLVIADRVRQRLADDTGERFDLDEVAGALGVDLESL